MSKSNPWILVGLIPLLLTLFAFSVWMTDDSDVDHAALISSWDDASYQQGRAIYQESCAQCHGADGRQPPNATAAAFVSDRLKSGSDPYAMWKTLTEGFNQMVPQTWLSPRERYQVIHYIREAFFKASNLSQYTEITEAYLDSLPSPSGQMAADERREMQYGPALTYELESTRSSLLLSLSDSLHLSYDLHTMSIPAVWTGDFVQLDATHHTEYKGGQRGRIAGDRLGVGPLRWAYDGLFEDPREGSEKQGPLPGWLVSYEGYYLHGDKTILSYEVSGRDILDLPKSIRHEGLSIEKHTMKIESGVSDLLLSVGQRRGSSPGGRYTLQGEKADVTVGPAAGHLLMTGSDTLAVAGITGDVEGLTWGIDGSGRMLLHIPPGEHSRKIQLVRTAGIDRERLLTQVSEVVSSDRAIPDPAVFTEGGPRRWNRTLTTAGSRGSGGGAYVVDSLGVPLENPWHSWMRLSGLDFFDDGRAAVATLNGDVWIVSGIDETLDELYWQRFATGLYEPLSVKVIDGKIYAVGRDRIIRLHDQNGDGEADFYESFHAFDHVSNGYHAFTFGVDTDTQGNLYVAQSGRKTDYPIPGAIHRISPDGNSSEIVGTGFRHPNGMTVGPDDRVFVSDNQGDWTPASKVSYVRENRFYGYIGWEDNTVDRETFQRPVFWLPQEVDNSSGGQAWVTDERWGPLANHMVHTSFGAGRMFYVLMQEVGDELQAAVVPFPWKFSTGLMRARMNPADGQLYAIGQRGWGAQSNVTIDGGFYRIRHADRPAHMLVDAEVTTDGLALTFSTALHEPTATDKSRIAIKRWNYKWSDQYGSPHYLPNTPDEEGEEHAEIEQITLSEDDRTLRISLSDHKSVDQMEVEFRLRAADGTPVEQTAYWTIKYIPRPKTSSVQSDG